MVKLEITSKLWEYSGLTLLAQACLVYGAVEGAHAEYLPPHNSLWWTVLSTDHLVPYTLGCQQRSQQHHLRSLQVKGKKSETKKIKLVKY